MLEAVNSVLSSAPLVRAQTDQVSTADSYAANPERVQRTSPQAPYISPYIYLDVNYDKSVIQLRNGDTGDVEDQYPSEASLQEAARQSARREIARQQTTQTAPQTEAQSAQAAIPQKNGGESVKDAPQPQQQSITPQQKAAFQAAAQSGNTNAGNVTLYA